jgi:hypothetical protein
MKNGDDKWRLADNPASVQVLRDILAAAESAYDPEGWDGRLWADAVDPRTGDYRRDALSMLSDPMAESIIGMIHDGWESFASAGSSTFKTSNASANSFANSVPLGAACPCWSAKCVPTPAPTKRTQLPDSRAVRSPRGM